MGEAGSVGWQFKRVAYFSIPVEGNSYDKIFELAVDGGADDVTQEDDYFEVIGPVENFKRLSDKFREAKIDIEEGELRMIPNQTMDLDVDDTLQVLRAIDSLEELDDVQHVFSNMNISQEALAALEAE